MHFFRDKQGAVYAFDDDQLWLVNDDMTSMSQDELDQHLNTAATMSRNDIEKLRLIAYADPIAGSDRYFSEAARLAAIGGSEDAIKAATAAGISRAAEIATMYPWPHAQNHSDG